MDSFNKLSLKQFIKMDQTSKQMENMKISKPNQQNSQAKEIRNQRRSSNKENRKLKLNTLPCEQIQNQQNEHEKFLFRSTWQGDIEHFKQQMKGMSGGCTSPTFATQILSNTNTHSNLFPPSERLKDQHQESIRNNIMQNSRSKSKTKNNKSLQKFIGENGSSHRPSNSTAERATLLETKPKNIAHRQMNDEQNSLYQLTKLQSLNHQLKRQNKNLKQKCQTLKEKCDQYETQHEKTPTSQNIQSCLMSNQQLFQKMRNEPFWKFYQKAQKLIRSSMIENNQQSTSPINFMKELEALRELTSEIKKQNKSLKKCDQQIKQQLQSSKDKLSIQQAEIEQMRLKCIAYECSIKKMREQMRNSKKQHQKLSQMSQLQCKIGYLTVQNVKLTQQLTSSRQHLQEQRLLNSECQKERVSIKKKYQQQQEQLNSVNKQLSSLKTSYNLIQMQRQQMSANKKELIEKQKLKEKIYQLEKQIKSLSAARQQEIFRMKQQYEQMYSKQIQLKDSHVKQLDQKVEKIVNNMNELERQKGQFSVSNNKLSEQLSKAKCQTSNLQNELKTVRKEKEAKLNEFSAQLGQLNKILKQQSGSIQNQSVLIRQLQKQINQKEELLRVKQYESQKLKDSLVMIRQEQSKTSSNLTSFIACSNPSNGQSKRALQDQSRLQNQSRQRQKLQMGQRIAELEEYIGKLEEKHNQALEMYEKVYNEKIQIQLQLQYYQHNQRNCQSGCSNRPVWSNNGENYPQNLSLSVSREEIMSLIESLLTLKEEIIRKILVFCPSQFKQLIIEYIYYGDMIKEKYLEMVCKQKQKPLSNRQNDNYTQEEPQSSYLHEDSEEQHDQYDNYAQSNQNRTIQRKNNSKSKSQYNQTKPYYAKGNRHLNISNDQDQSDQEDKVEEASQQIIDQLMQKFVKIGKLIEDQTKHTYTGMRRNAKDKRNSDNSSSLERQGSHRISNEKHQRDSHKMKLTKNQKAYSNDQNQFHYRLGQTHKQVKSKPTCQQNSHRQDSSIEDNCRFYQANRQAQRKPLQVIQQQNQFSKRPPSISKELRNYSLADNKVYNDQKAQNRPSFYQDQSSISKDKSRQQGQVSTKPGLVTPNYQNSYHKGSSNKLVKKNNFNHGSLNNLNLLKMIDKIKHQ